MSPGARLAKVLTADAVLTDSGLETDLIFHHGFDLPCFAAFPLLDDPEGAATLADYYREHALVAVEAGVPFLFETPTWRANPDWGARLGYDLPRLAAVNVQAVSLVRGIGAELGPALAGFAISGCLGPRGDGYAPENLMTAGEAQDYHSWQIGVLAGSGVDLVTAMTLTYVAEAIGIVRAALRAGCPVVIGFTVETDGRLPDGTALADAIVRVDEATDGAALYFMINCAHPTHFATVLDPDAAWTGRVRAVRANASRMSHAELDEAEQLDDGDPLELSEQYVDLLDRAPGLLVLGGCCGTDVRHIAAIGDRFRRSPA
jgi:homocysteine S-methyltransferase